MSPWGEVRFFGILSLVFWGYLVFETWSIERHARLEFLGNAVYSYRVGELYSVRSGKYHETFLVLYTRFDKVSNQTEVIIYRPFWQWISNKVGNYFRKWV